MPRGVAMSGKKIRSDTERALEEHAALPSLQTLVDSGCDRSELISYMEVAFMADDSWKTLVDMNLRAFKGSIKKIRDCAGVIDRLNRSELIYHMSIEAKDARFVGIHESPTLPVRLREYADKLDWLRHVFGPKRNIRLNAWRGWIVAVVMENTEKPHDREVSSLIAAVLNDSQYSESAHRAWRSKHIDVIDAMRKTLKEHRREKHPSHS